MRIRLGYGIPRTPLVRLYPQDTAVSPGYRRYPQDTVSQDTAVSWGGHRILRGHPRVSWDTVSPGYRPLSWGYPSILRMPLVSHDANLRFQTLFG